MTHRLALLLATGLALLTLSATGVDGTASGQDASATESILLGTWDIKIGTDSDTWTFRNGGVVARATQPTLKGEWKKEANCIRIQWDEVVRGRRTWETFILPLKENETRGVSSSGKEVSATKVKSEQGLENASVADVNPRVRIIGQEEVVFDWTRDAAEKEDIPDMPARAFRDAAGRVQLIATCFNGRRMIGSELGQVKPDPHVLMYSHKDADPAQFNDREWLASVYTLDGKTIYALVHNEYQGHEHPGRHAPSRGDYWTDYGKGWYNSFTFAQSVNGGYSYTHAPAPGHLLASLPVGWKFDAGPAGIFQPSNIICNPKDGHYYVLFNACHRVGDEWFVTSIMRTKNLADPASWRAWDGKDFTVQFVNPYTCPEAERAKHIFKYIAYKEIQSMYQSLTYNTYFKKYILVGYESYEDRQTGKTVHGFCFSLSDNLIDWSPRRLIMRANQGTSDEPGPLLGFPSLLDPTDQSRNFEVTGKRPYLYYTEHRARTPKNEGYDRDLVRVQLEFE
jgi:hypothetical protein